MLDNDGNHHPTLGRARDRRSMVRIPWKDSLTMTDTDSIDTPTVCRYCGRPVNIPGERDCRCSSGPAGHGEPVDTVTLTKVQAKGRESVRYRVYTDGHLVGIVGRVEGSTRTGGLWHAKRFTISLGTSARTTVHATRREAVGALTGKDR